MKEITLTAVLSISFLFGISQSFPPYEVFGTTSGATDKKVQIYDGYVIPYSNGDQATLEIHSTQLNIGQVNQITYSTANPALLNVGSVGDTKELVRFYVNSGTGYYRMVQAQVDKYVAEYVNGGQSQLYLNWTNNYNIGIGTSTPNANAQLDVNGKIFSTGLAIGTTDMAQIGTYALAVNGNAIFNKVKVKLYGGWADYVFHKDYKLPKLDEIESFIKANGHLPEMPTTAEVEKNGIDIAENQTLLLKKIEELTLILIDQNKKIEEQSKQIAELQKGLK